MHSYYTSLFCLYVRMYVCMYICMYVCKCAAQIRRYFYTFLCIYVCMFVYMYVWVGFNTIPYGTVAVNMPFGISCNSDAEVFAVSAANVCDQIGCRGEAAFHLLPGLAGRRVSAQGEDIANARLLTLLQHLHMYSVVRSNLYGRVKCVKYRNGNSKVEKECIFETSYNLLRFVLMNVWIHEYMNMFIHASRYASPRRWLPPPCWCRWDASWHRHQTSSRYLRK